MLKDLTASQRKPTSRVMKVRSPIFSPNSARNYSTEYSLHELSFLYIVRLPCDAIFAPAHNSTHQKPISDGIPITTSDQFSTWFNEISRALTLLKMRHDHRQIKLDTQWGSNLGV